MPAMKAGEVFIINYQFCQDQGQIPGVSSTKGKMKGSPLLLQIVLHIHMYMLCMYVCAYACIGLYTACINQYCYHLLLKIFTKVCSLKCEYQKNSFLHCEVPRIKQLQGKFDQPTHVSAYLNMQPLFSTEYSKPLVPVQALFLKHVVYEYVRGWKIHLTHPLPILMYTHTLTPCKNFRVSLLTGVCAQGH